MPPASKLDILQGTLASVWLNLRPRAGHCLTPSALALTLVAVGMAGCREIS